LSAVKAIEGGKDVRVSIAAAIERALIDAGLLFLEPGDTRDGGRGLRFRLMLYALTILLRTARGACDNPTKDWTFATMRECPKAAAQTQRSVPPNYAEMGPKVVRLLRAAGDGGLPADELYAKTGIYGQTLENGVAASVSAPTISAIRLAVRE
jgi:hypothetical protein